MENVVCAHGTGRARNFFFFEPSHSLRSASILQNVWVAIAKDSKRSNDYELLEFSADAYVVKIKDDYFSTRTREFRAGVKLHLVATTSKTGKPTPDEEMAAFVSTALDPSDSLSDAGIASNARVLAVIHPDGVCFGGAFSLLRVGNFV